MQRQQHYCCLMAQQSGDMRRENGGARLVEYRYHGGAGHLAEIDIRSLENHLRKHTYHTVTEICRYVKERFGVSYSVVGMTHLLYRRGFVYKKTKVVKVVPGRFDPKKQERLLPLYNAIKQCKEPEDRMYFLEALPPQHNTMGIINAPFRVSPKRPFSEPILIRIVAWRTIPFMRTQRIATSTFI